VIWWPDLSLAGGCSLALSLFLHCSLVFRLMLLSSGGFLFSLLLDAAVVLLIGRFVFVYI
jgi:hypothetical protein